MDKKITELIEQIQSLAPEMWEVLVRQQYIEGGVLLSVAAVLFGVAVLVRVVVDDDFARVFVPVAALTFAAIFFTLGMMNVLNPEYYAIEALIPQ